MSFAFPCINLGPKTSCTDGDISYFYTVFPPQCGSSTPNKVTIYFDHTLSNSLFPTHPTVRWNIICLIYIVDKWNIITQIFFPQFVIIFARHAFTFINIIVIKIIMWQSCSLLLAGFKAMCTTPFHSQKFRTFFQRQPLFLMILVINKNDFRKQN